MEALKGIVKVVGSLIAIGAGSELGKRGLGDINKSLPKKSN